MKNRGYLAGDYEHGLQITDKARRRLSRVRLSDIIIQPQKVWDKTWRIVIYDIPEEHASARRNLTRQLRCMGCFQLQRSTWITPFPCRSEVEAIRAQYHIKTKHLILPRSSLPAVHWTSLFLVNVSRYVSSKNSRPLLGMINLSGGAILNVLSLDQFITYFEAQHLDNSHGILKRFQRKYLATKF